MTNAVATISDEIKRGRGWPCVRGIVGASITYRTDSGERMRLRERRVRLVDAISLVPRLVLNRVSCQARLEYQPWHTDLTGARSRVLRCRSVPVLASDLAWFAVP